jgi:foldase protein PrsA
VNNSKKTIKYPKQEKKEKKRINPIIWIISSIVLVVALVGSLLFDQLYKRVILTIDDDKYYMEDLAYYFYGVESAYDYYNQMLGGQYWDMVVDQSTGSTTRDMAMKEALESSLFTEIVYREAVAQGYSLTDEEKETIKKDVTSQLDEQLTADIIKKNGFTEEYLTNIMSKTTLVTRYRQDIIDSLDIDDEGIKAGIDYDKYRQYDVEYVFLSTEKKDDDDKTVPMDENEKAAALDKINDFHEKALKAEDWSELIPKEEKEVVYREDSFLESDTVFSEDLKAKIIKMENNTISGVLEDESGYYFVRMINNNSTESYDDAVKKAITEAENEGFAKVYNEIADKYQYKINTKALRRYKMGNITLS